MKTNVKKKKGEDIEDILAKLHPKFINLIKDIQPIAFLASLCLIIATFSKGDFGYAQTYAIAAAFVFILAFVFSICFRLMPSLLPLATMSYSSTGIGIILLSLVALEYARASPLASPVGILIFYLGIFLPIIILPAVYYTTRLAYTKLKETATMKTILIYVLPCIGGFLMLVSSLFGLYADIIGEKTLESINSLLLILGIVLFIFGGFLVIVYEQHLRKKKKQKGHEK